MDSQQLDKEQLVKTFISFLSEIGIGVFEREIEGNTFLPGLEIEKGVLFYDFQKLLYPGDMLHEAGHIAVTTKAERDQLKNNVITNNKDKEGDEMAVLLWTYAACVKLGIVPEIVFHKDGYKGSADWLVENFTNKVYIGLPLLKWMGMTNDNFPEMIKWLRD